MLIVCIIFLIVYLFIQVINLLVISIIGFDKAPNHHSSPLPTLAILVAARNEAENLPQCLQSLVKLDYPKQLMEIWVGNDQSEDATEQIIDEFASQYPFIKKLNITENIGLAKGKANVLAQLAHQSSASFFLITDADIQVKTEWAKTMLGFFNHDTGIVSGTTVVDHSGYLKPMQQMDWLYFMGLLLTFNRFKIPSTAVGNNMAIKREAYFATGGYENISFSVTEDFSLFKAVRDIGWKTVNMLHPDAINVSAPAANFTTLINQRKRWLTGAKALPLTWWVIFGIFGAFIPCICLLVAIAPTAALLIYAIKLGIQSITIYVQQKQLKLPTSFVALIVYEMYTCMVTLLTVTYFLIPKKLNWKNRYY